MKKKNNIIGLLIVLCIITLIVFMLSILTILVILYYYIPDYSKTNNLSFKLNETNAKSIYNYKNKIKIEFDNGSNLDIIESNEEYINIIVNENAWIYCSGTCSNCPSGVLTGGFSCGYKGTITEATSYCQSKLDECCYGAGCAGSYAVSCS